MTNSREGHRLEALNELLAAQGEGDVTKTNRLLEALVHAVLALSAPTEEELRKQDARDRMRDEMRRGNPYEDHIA